MSGRTASLTDLSWVERYRPRTLDELVGHNRVVEQMKAWARSWSSDTPPKKRALILEGEPGVGKTTAAIALANDMDWEVIELNASDARNLESIRKMATRGAMSRDITDVDGFSRGTGFKRKLIMIDEADNLYERGAKTEDGSDMSDRGGKRAIVELVRLTGQPVILIVNDLYGLISGSGGSLSFTCEKLKFRRLGPASVVKRLKKICSMEGISYDDEVLQAIAERSGGDMRSAVGDLQMVSVGRNAISMKDLSVLGFRDNRENIFNTMDHVFKADSLVDARRYLREVDENIDSLMLWFTENLTIAMSHYEDVDRGMQYLSRADVYLGRVRRRQNYKLWKYAKDTIAALGIARKHPNRNRSRYQFPSYLKSMSRTKETRALLKEASGLIGRYTHTSMRTIKEDAIHRYGLLAGREPDFASFMVAEVGLGKEHLNMISGGRISKKDMKEIIEKAKKYLSEKAAPKSRESEGLMAYHTEDESRIEEDTGTVSDSGDEEGPKQTSLLEF